jgi:hypothetical protein
LTLSQGFPRVLYPIRRKLTQGLEIWKYNATKDKWTPVIFGINKGVCSAGFGDRYNEYPWSMTVDSEHLFVGTMRPDSNKLTFYRKGFLKWNMSFDITTGGSEIWRFDGTNWDQINEDGFGNKYNFGTRELLVYKNSLFACTMNLKDGCELWKYNLG